jgi:hydrogenase expression/formation protein HypC
MCLAVPGKIVSLTGEPPFGRLGSVDFGGIQKQVSLAFLPEAQVGDYVLVHVGVAISRVDEAEAQRVFGYLEEIEALEQELNASPLEPAS